MIETWEDLKNKPVNNPGKFIKRKISPAEKLIHPGIKQFNTIKHSTADVKRLLNPKPRI